MENMINIKIAKTNYRIDSLIIDCFFISSFFGAYALTSSIHALDYVNYIGAFFAIVYWVKTGSHNYKVKLMEFLIILCLLYTSIKTQNFSYFTDILIILAARNMDIKAFIKLFNKNIEIQIVVGVLIWILNFFVNLGIPVYFDQYEKRISFGFLHPNKLAVIIIWWCISEVLLSEENNRRIKVIITTLIATFFFACTKTSSFIMYYIYIILFLAHKNEFIKDIAIKISKYIFLILGICVYVLQHAIANSESFIYGISQKINSISNYRLIMSYLAEKINGITLFGQKVNYKHNWGDYGLKFGNYTIDILYTCLFVCIGLVYFVVLSYCFYELAKYKNYNVAILIIIFSLYSLTELHNIYITYSFVLIFLKTILFREKNINI